MTSQPPTPITGTGQRLYEEAKKIFPGGTQLLSKRPEMMAPQQWPSYYAKAQGCEVTDLDGKTYIDMFNCGIGATFLGYADPDVTAAVIDAVRNGSMTMLNPPAEVELARLMLEIHPWAQRVRLGRLGGESMTMAVRIARARTRRDKVAFCGYHGWHDWYLSANLPRDGADGIDDRLGGYHLLPGLEPRGIPRGLAGTSMAFNYNKIDELKAIVDREGDDLAAIVMEPLRTFEPEPGFLEGVRELADHCGARLIFDEITIGWKLCLGGAHMKYGIEPDLAVFSKSTGNGHPISVVIGTADTMDAAQETFVSSALWTEAVGPAAAVAVIRKMKRIDVPGHVARVADRARRGLTRIAAAHGVPMQPCGLLPITTVRFDHAEAAALGTLWTVRMLDHGFLAGNCLSLMLAHEDHHVDAFLKAADQVCAILAEAIEHGDIAARIGGPVKHSGFRRLA